MTTTTTIPADVAAAIRELDEFERLDLGADPDPTALQSLRMGRALLRDYAPTGDLLRQIVAAAKRGGGWRELDDIGHALYQAAR